jgi:hypothetical protein
VVVDTDVRRSLRIKILKKIKVKHSKKKAERTGTLWPALLLSLLVLAQ